MTPPPPRMPHRQRHSPIRVPLPGRTPSPSKAGFTPLSPRNRDPPIIRAVRRCRAARGSAAAASRTPSRTPSLAPSRTPSGTPRRTPSRTPSLAPSRTPSGTPRRTSSKTPSCERGGCQGTPGQGEGHRATPCTNQQGLLVRSKGRAGTVPRTGGSGRYLRSSGKGGPAPPAWPWVSYELPCAIGMRAVPEPRASYTGDRGCSRVAGDGSQWGRSSPHLGLSCEIQARPDGLIACLGRAPRPAKRPWAAVLAAAAHPRIQPVSGHPPPEPSSGSSSPPCPCPRAAADEPLQSALHGGAGLTGKTASRAALAGKRQVKPPSLLPSLFQWGNLHKSSVSLALWG